MSLKTPKIGYFNKLLYRLNQGYGVLLAPLNLFYKAVIIYLYI